MLAKMNFKTVILNILSIKGKMDIMNRWLISEKLHWIIMEN